MKKILTYDILSDSITCVNCPKPIKLRLVIVREKHNIRCYNCHRRFEANRGHFINQNPRKKRIVLGLPVKSFG